MLCCFDHPLYNNGERAWATQRVLAVFLLSVITVIMYRYHTTLNAWLKLLWSPRISIYHRVWYSVLLIIHSERVWATQQRVLAVFLLSVIMYRYHTTVHYWMRDWNYCCDLLGSPYTTEYGTLCTSVYMVTFLLLCIFCYRVRFFWRDWNFHIYTERKTRLRKVRKR
jgi:hypothetical protein